jgi:hypothetical protein
MKMKNEKMYLDIDITKYLVDRDTTKDHQAYHVFMASKKNNEIEWMTLDETAKMIPDQWLLNSNDCDHDKLHDLIVSILDPDIYNMSYPPILYRRNEEKQAITGAYRIAAAMYIHTVLEEMDYEWHMNNDVVDMREIGIPAMDVTEYAEEWWRKNREINGNDFLDEDWSNIRNMWLSCIRSG